MAPVHVAEVSELEWKVLIALKREFTPEEIAPSPWRARAAEAGLALGGILPDRRIAQRAEDHRTFLDFSRARETFGRRRARHTFQRSFPLGGAGGTRNGSGRRSRAGITSSRTATGAKPDRNSGTSTSWRSRTAPTKSCFSSTNAAIDEHLEACGIPVSYTNVFWGGRSEIKPSEISPEIYRELAARDGGRSRAASVEALLRTQRNR